MTPELVYCHKSAAPDQFNYVSEASKQKTEVTQTQVCHQSTGVTVLKVKRLLLVVFH